MSDSYLQGLTYFTNRFNHVDYAIVKLHEIIKKSDLALAITDELLQSQWNFSEKVSF